MWNFVDGYTSTEQHPFHTYEREGYYDVSLTVYKAVNNKQRKIKFDDSGNNYIRVMPPPPTLPVIKEFSPPTGKAFIPPDLPTKVTIAITNVDGILNKDKTKESFKITRSIPREGLRETPGGRVDIAGSKPTYILTFTPDKDFEYGWYQTCLQLIDATGNQADEQCSSFIIYQPRGIPRFEAQQTSEPLKVEFTDTSTGNPNKWEWDFGDGSEPSEERNPTHIYSGYVTYTIQLTVTYANGWQDSIEKKITLMHADFTATPTEGDAPLEVDFEDMSQGPITSRTWDFGDKEIWDFAEETGVLQHLTHVYPYPGTYTVILTVRNADTGWEHTKTQDIVVVDRCRAVFEVQPTGEPFEMQFTDNSTGEVTERLWNFGHDGATNTELSPKHIFPDYGTYTVSLTVTCSDGRTDTASQEIILVPPPCQAAFEYQISDLEVQFTDASEGNITDWAWDFGHDNATSDQPSLKHTFPDYGTYTVSLTIICSDGRTDIASQEIILIPLPCQAAFEYQISDLEVQFTDNSTGNPTEWAWDFGHDDATSGQPSLKHTFLDYGAYNVSLTVTCDDGRTDTISQQIVLQPLPLCQAAFEYDISDLDIQFTDNSTGNIIEHVWDFGHDDSTSVELSPKHTFPDYGSYTVILTVTCADGNTETTSQQIVLQTPISGGEITGRVLSAADNQVLRHLFTGKNISAQLQLRHEGKVLQDVETSTNDGSYTLKQVAEEQQYQIRAFASFYFPASLDDVGRTFVLGFCARSDGRR